MIEKHRGQEAGQPGPDDDAWREILAMAAAAAGILVAGIVLVVALVWAVFRAF